MVGLLVFLGTFTYCCLVMAIHELGIRLIERKENKKNGKK